MSSRDWEGLISCPAQLVLLMRSLHQKAGKCIHFLVPLYSEKKDRKPLPKKYYTCNAKTKKMKESHEWGIIVSLAKLWKQKYVTAGKETTTGNSLDTSWI